MVCMYIYIEGYVYICICIWGVYIYISIYRYAYIYRCIEGLRIYRYIYIDIYRVHPAFGALSSFSRQSNESKHCMIGTLHESRCFRSTPGPTGFGKIRLDRLECQKPIARMQTCPACMLTACKHKPAVNMAMPTVLVLLVHSLAGTERPGLPFASRLRRGLGDRVGTM